MKKNILKQGLLLSILLPIITLFCYPLLWLISACFKTDKELYRPLHLLPEKWNFEYFAMLFSGEIIDFWSYWSNSLIFTFSQAILAVMVSSTAAYAFTYKEFRFKKLIFIIAVALVLIPGQIMVFPLRELIFDLKLNDNLLAIILPGALSGIGILFFIQIYRSLPSEFVEMAKLEGAGDVRAFFMTLPIIASPLICCFMIHFLMAWQQHLMPLLLLNENQVLPVSLGALFSSSKQFPQALIMCAGLFCVLPSIVLFVLTFKKFRSALADHVVH
jgi:ABC-type glycerol-3-phosphate transport system permease component